MPLKFIEHLGNYLISTSPTKQERKVSWFIVRSGEGDCLNLVISHLLESDCLLSSETVTEIDVTPNSFGICHIWEWKILVVVRVILLDIGGVVEEISSLPDS
jgi:hypothetical protein